MATVPIVPILMLLLIIALTTNRLVIDRANSTGYVTLRKYEFTAVTFSALLAVGIGLVTVLGMNSRDTALPTAALVFGAPILVGFVYSVGVVLSTLIWPRPRVRWRSANLVQRGLSTMLPRRHAALLCAAVIGFVVVSGFGILLAARDGETFGWGLNYGTFARGHFFPLVGDSIYGGIVVNSMFPGWRITLPVAVGVSLLLATSYFALWTISHRPATNGSDIEDDLRARRTSAARLSGVTTGCILVSTSGLVALAGAGVSTALPEHFVGIIGEYAAWVGIVLSIVLSVLTVVVSFLAERLIKLDD